MAFLVLLRPLFNLSKNPIQKLLLLSFNFLYVKLNCLRDTALRHRYTVKTVTDLHSTTAVGDKNKLSSITKALDIFTESEYVNLVERRLDLVEDTERRGVNLKYCKQKRYCNEGLLTTRKKRKALDDLAGRCRLDLDTRGKYILRIGELMLCIALSIPVKKFALE